jgi:hypothetical protein
MTSERDSAAARKPLPEPTDSEYQAIVDRVKTWNPNLWDEWAALSRRRSTWSPQEAAEHEHEFEEQNKSFRSKVQDFLLEQNIAKDKTEAWFFLNYVEFACLKEHGLW